MKAETQEGVEEGVGERRSYKAQDEGTRSEQEMPGKDVQQQLLSCPLPHLIDHCVPQEVSKHHVLSFPDLSSNEYNNKLLLILVCSCLTKDLTTVPAFQSCPPPSASVH